MEITGKVFKILQLQTGEGKNGTWKKQEFILEIPGQFSKKLCICLWGDNITQFPLAEGEEITAMIDLESREFNNKWYTDVKAWKIVKAGSVKSTSSEQIKDIPDSFPTNEPPDISGTDDLPF
jgi:hypothetical protein